MNDYKATIETILQAPKSNPDFYWDKLDLDQATASLLQLLTEARIEELESISVKAIQHDEPVFNAIVKRLAELERGSK